MTAIDCISESIETKHVEIPFESGNRTMVYASNAMEEVVARSHAYADYRHPVLLTGENGTGKEMIARLLHAFSARRGKPFQATNCGSIPTTLVESTMFGSTKGAFTGASKDRKGHADLADGGTWFLDEIGDLLPDAQVSLNRLASLGEIAVVGDAKVHHVDVRLVAATHRDLRRMVVDGRFREDLFYRLDVLRIHVPALRERISDIAPIVDHIMASDPRGEWGSRSSPARWFTPRAWEVIHAYPWPGNVRELEAAIHRGIANARLAHGARIDTEHLELGTSTPVATQVRRPGRPRKTLALPRDEIAARLATGESDRKVAAACGVSVDTLRRRLGASRLARAVAAQPSGAHAQSK